MQAAYQVATENDKIVVFGSFYTVAAAMTYLQKNTTAIHAK
jgi:folylpolyglutamate synthase/dihydropteroate synthase